MEEYLLSQLDTPVVLKDGTMMTKPDGSPMTKQEAIATNILNLAMKEQREQSQTACRLSYAESRRRKADRPRATEGCPVHPEHSDEGEDHEKEVKTNEYETGLSVPAKREAA